MQSQLKKINLIYSTQTGTSYDLAKEFYLKNRNKLFFNNFIDIGQIKQFSQTQKDCIWLFFISTTGQGDFPYSMRNIWKKMLSKTFQSLNWMKFSIYSFGDRSYGQNFCLAARKFRQRLISLQAQQIVQIGLGDQQQPNGYLQQYRDNWFPKLSKFLQLDNNNKTTIIKTNEKSQIESKINENNNYLKKYSNHYKIRMIDRKQICSNKGRRTFTIDFQIQDYFNNIKTGEILNIYPYNNPQDVNYLMKLFKFEQNSAYNNQLKYRELFSSYLNISSTLNHSFFIERQDIPNLSQYCQNQLFKQKLVQLQKDYDQYHNYIKKYKRNVIQVLKDFQIQKLPVNQFIKRCTDVVPRKYSISQILSNGEKKIVRVLFKLVNDKINQNRIHKGICSHDLGLWIQKDEKRIVNILKGQFQYVQKAKNNIICISLGTGIAPFIQLMDMAKNSQQIWNLQVFYTNRYQNQVYFQQFLQELVTQNKLNPFLSFTAQGGKRIIRLVQDNIKYIKKLIQESNNDFKIMICGPKQVCQGIQNVLTRQLQIDCKLLKKKKLFIYQNW